MITQSAGSAALRAVRVVFDGPAVDVGERLADGGTGDRQAEFDGTADRVGNKVCIWFTGPAVCSDVVSEPPSSHRRILYILCLSGSSTDRPHALRIRKSQ